MLKTKQIITIVLTNLLSVTGGVFIGHQLERFGDSIGWAHGHFLHQRDAESNNPEGQYLLGIDFFEGKTVDRDLSKAVFWLTKSANNNYIETQLELANMYETEKGVTQSENFAWQFYKMAADHIQKKLLLLKKEK